MKQSNSSNSTKKFVELEVRAVGSKLFEDYCLAGI
jgi:hypothetical protein